MDVWRMPCLELLAGFGHCMRGPPLFRVPGNQSKPRRSEYALAYKR
jgi:hypothetical protein